MVVNLMDVDPLVVVSTHAWSASPVEDLARQTGREVHHITARDDLDPARLEEIGPRWVFVLHWSWIIPAAIYEHFEVVIFHMTDLPYGRGGSPLQNLIVRGHERTMISAIRCIEEMDAGPVYLKRELSLHGSAEEIYLRGSRIIGQMMLQIVEEQPEPQPQQGQPVIFSRRHPADSDLSQVTSLEQAYDLIRMLDAEGYPHAYLDVGPLRLQFRRVSQRSDGLHADVHITLREPPT